MKATLARKTKTSAAVIKGLKEKKSPMSIAQIQAQLKQEGLTPNKTTVYRIMEKLKIKGKVQEIVFRLIILHQWL